MSIQSIRHLALRTTLPWILVIGGVIGLLCSLILAIDKIEVLSNPAFDPVCDINPVLSCKSVMVASQSQVFGFDNTLLGLPWFGALIGIGAALLAGATLKRWFWLGLQAGITGSLLLVHWFVYTSLYTIGSLCPFCMVVWIVTITLFWYISLYNLEQYASMATHNRLSRLIGFVRRHHIDILLCWFAIIIVLILNRFWYYYGPLLGF